MDAEKLARAKRLIPQLTELGKFGEARMILTTLEDDANILFLSTLLESLREKRVAVEEDLRQLVAGIADAEHALSVAQSRVGSFEGLLASAEVFLKSMPAQPATVAASQSALPQKTARLHISDVLDLSKVRLVQDVSVRIETFTARPIETAWLRYVIQRILERKPDLSVYKLAAEFEFGGGHPFGGSRTQNQKGNNLIFDMSQKLFTLLGALGFSRSAIPTLKHEEVLSFLSALKRPADKYQWLLIFTLAGGQLVPEFEKLDQGADNYKGAWARRVQKLLIPCAGFVWSNLVLAPLSSDATKLLSWLAEYRRGVEAMALDEVVGVLGFQLGGPTRLGGAIRSLYAFAEGWYGLFCDIWREIPDYISDRELTAWYEVFGEFPLLTGKLWKDFRILVCGLDGEVVSFQRAVDPTKDPPLRRKKDGCIQVPDNCLVAHSRPHDDVVVVK